MEIVGPAWTLSVRALTLKRSALNSRNCSVFPVCFYSETGMCHSRCDTLRDSVSAFQFTCQRQICSRIWKWYVVWWQFSSNCLLHCRADDDSSFAWRHRLRSDSRGGRVGGGGARDRRKQRGCRCALIARISRKFAQFTNLTSCCYTH